MDHDRRAEKMFSVKVGAAECTVTCCSEQEAVEELRCQFRRQMPQMGTAIPGIDQREFEVSQVH